MTISVALIEDSREIQGLVEDLLGHIGPFQVIGRIATEHEGTAWLDNHPQDWDVALIDLVLREGSGFNLIRRYREANEKARILVLSDYATTPIKVRCVELGADAVFTKGEMKAFASYMSMYKPRAQPPSESARH